MNNKRVTDLGEAFEARVIRADGCWGWTGSHAVSGYTRIEYQAEGRRTHILGHRLSYELHVGTIPEGLVIDHLCRNRSCVNPEHLEAITNEENVARGTWGPARSLAAQGRMIAAARAERPSAPRPSAPGPDPKPVFICRNGHEVSGANRYVRPNGLEDCYECRRDASARRRRIRLTCDACGKQMGLTAIPKHPCYRDGRWDYRPAEAAARVGGEE